MECVVKIQLKENAPIKKILNIFKVNKSKERATFLKDDYDVFMLNNVLSIPYGMLGEDPQIVMDYVIFKLTEVYAVHEKHLVTGELFPCYYVNNPKTFLTLKDINEPYGMNLTDMSKLNIEQAVQLLNDSTNVNPIAFVDTQHIINADMPGIRTEIRDAIERAEFIIYDHTENLDKKQSLLFQS